MNLVVASVLLIDCPMATIGVLLVILRAVVTLLPKMLRTRSFLGIGHFLSQARLAAAKREGHNHQESRERHQLLRLGLVALAEKRGYSLESHDVHTADGYILTMHRLPRKPLQQQQQQTDDSGEGEGCPSKTDAEKERRVAFVQHGLKCSSADWLTGSGFAFVLADKGYDVWLGNFRGNKFARRHLTLKSRDKAFWNFSWDEHGTFDLPAMLNYVRGWTGVTKIDYFGHSMGTTAFVVMSNTMPDAADCIGRCVFMAPVTTLAHLQGMPYWFIRVGASAIRVANLCSIYCIEFPRSIPGYSFLATIMLFVMGFHHLDFPTVHEILRFCPAGSSTENVRHFIACYQRGKFQSRNMNTAYELSKVRHPVEIMYSRDDWAAGERDTWQIAKELPNVISCRRIESKGFGHLDFMWSRVANDAVYKILLE